jgi:hypothetical protein
LSTRMAGRGVALGRRSPCGMAATGASKDTNTNTTSSENTPVDRMVDRGAQRRWCWMWFSLCFLSRRVAAPEAAWCDMLVPDSCVSPGGLPANYVSGRDAATFIIRSFFAIAATPWPAPLRPTRCTVVAQTSASFRWCLAEMHLHASYRAGR